MTSTEIVAVRHGASTATTVELVPPLKALRASMRELRGSIVASVDGLPLASDLRANESAGVAAMAATAAGLGKRIVDDLGFGSFEETVVRAERGYLVVYSAGPSAVLAVVAGAGANIGLVNLESRRCAGVIADLLA